MSMSYRQPAPAPPRQSRLNSYPNSSAAAGSSSSSYADGAPMYTLPLESPVSNKVAPSRPGGLAGQAHTRSPPLPPRRSYKGRQSEESVYSYTRSQEGQARPGTLRRDSSGVMSVHSARGANVFEDGPSKADLDRFTHHCRLFYFSTEHNEPSSRYISSTLAALSPSHRAIYSRIQSSLRSAAHLHHLRIRIASFHAFLASIVPSDSLPPAARSQPRGKHAQAERRRRLKDFLDKWCTSGNAGTEPFFRGLRAVMKVQSRGDLGGAGGKRVVWEVDDAVFQESGGPDFMQEAVTILKGVFGFTDQPLTSAPRVRHPDEQGQEVLRDSTRKRAPPPPPPPTAPRRQSSDSATDYQPLLKGRSNSNESNAAADAAAAEEADLNLPRFRLWTFPAHIDDQEIAALLALFPAFIAGGKGQGKGKGRDVRLPLTRSGAGVADKAEEAAWKPVEVDGKQVAKVPVIEQEIKEGVLRCGTGRMWRGEDDREGPWEGNAWFRFIEWLKRIFGL